MSPEPRNRVIAQNTEYAQGSGPYVRPQWTGKIPTFWIGDEDNLAWSECPSCLGTHAASLIGCNGKRDPAYGRCEATLGEIQCERPDNHLGEHDVRSDLMDVTWRVRGDRADLATRAEWEARQ